MLSIQNGKRIGWFLLVLLLALDGVIVVWAFAEEEIGFRDVDGTYYPPTGSFPDNRVSTIHDDLTYALALAAGFSVTDSQKIRIWDQLVDSEALPSAVVSYTYGNAGFYNPPNENIACLGKNHARQVWPTNGFDPNTSSVTSRFGPYSPFFHFPHLNGSDLKALRDWGWGITNTLVGYEAYAWGRLIDPTLYQAVQNGGCAITRTVTISTPIQAGSIMAFATYLHSLDDAYSHYDCLTAVAAVLPWGTHTVTITGDASIYACDYNPNSPTNIDAHGREFGATYTDTARTLNAAHAIYTELSTRGLQREGVYIPLPLTTTLTVSGSITTLDGAISHFVLDRNYDNPTYRRQYVDSLVYAITTTVRAAIDRLYLPVISR